MARSLARGSGANQLAYPRFGVARILGDFRILPITITATDVYCAHPREIDGLTSTEICQILNVTPSNLGVLLHRGRNKLRRLLEVEWFQKHTPAPPPKSKRTLEAFHENHLLVKNVSRVRVVDGHATI